MPVAPITTHVADAQTRLLQQYSNRPRIQAIIATAAGGVQRLEDAIEPVLVGRFLFGGKAVGAQLDRLGELVGLARNGADDGLYRVLILGTIGRNTTDATMGRILDVIRTVYQASDVFFKTPNAPAQHKPTVPAVIAYGVVAPQTPDTYFGVCQGIVQNSLAAGVAVSHIVSMQAGRTFAMAGRQSWVQGFSSVENPDSGGRFPHLIFSNKAQ